MARVKITTRQQRHNNIHMIRWRHGAVGLVIYAVLVKTQTFDIDLDGGGLFEDDDFSGDVDYSALDSFSLMTTWL